MSAHTPGPWFRDGRSLWIKSSFEEPDGTNGVATVSARGTRTDANARLIAAAPELLEALRALVDEHMKLAPDFGTADQVLAALDAIAKAEGKE